MKIIYKKSKGSRLKKQFFDITVEGSVWWVPQMKLWYAIDNIPKGMNFQSFCPCKSVKAFKRHVRKHPEVSCAYNLRLNSKYIGYSVMFNSSTFDRLNKGDV